MTVMIPDQNKFASVNGITFLLGQVTYPLEFAATSTVDHCGGADNHAAPPLM
jgi:hypothetical protein